VIDNSPAMKVVVIHSLCAKNMSAVEIYCDLCTVYGQNIIREGTVKTMV
jgi:hypothetical protein